ncbi:MAG: hypothetical protein VW931_01045 [Alphaproteobacteria bacterium]
MLVVEVENRQVKVNPLAGWIEERIDTYFNKNDLPRHPLPMGEGSIKNGALRRRFRVLV